MTEIDDFISRQLAMWPEAARRYDDLSRVEVKTVGGYRVQFNPARAVSTAARVDAASIAARPCFLCSANRPAGQIAMEWEDLEILLNPFPIFPNHLTIPARQHMPQSMRGRVGQMRRLSRALPGYTVFFNGAKCGASAPDHFHFQAVPSRYMQIPERIYSYVLPEADFSAEELDPMVNMYCTDGVVTVIPRTKHRPDCYGELIVSPAAIDLAGTLISVRREDFERLDAARMDEILREVTFSEPPVYVGLIAEHPHVTELADGSTEVEGMVIGHGFHWQERMTQRFAGEMIADGERLFNRIAIEEYLASVISSEMSAQSPAELLKAHAVISRSWLLSQMRAFRSMADEGVPVSEPECEADEVRQWFDSDDHAGFDVCSDDHCQRYQGITRIVSGAAAEAVAATRGLVLMTPDGKICDARFSKCCGGALERFETCWQPMAHSYLRPLDGTPDLTVEANAREWILSRPEACCSDTPAEVLDCVLNDFDRRSTPDFYRWTVRYSRRQLSGLIARRSGLDFGEIRQLVPLSRGASGRISRLKIIGSKLTRTVGKELMIRRWLSETHLYSSAFTVDCVGDDFVIRGAGWGHGVGLCQIGAATLAWRGMTFDAILRRYYPGAELKALY